MYRQRIAVDFDRKEYLSPLIFGEDALLPEFALTDKCFPNAVRKLLEGSWKDDCVALVEDPSSGLRKNELRRNHPIKVEDIRNGRIITCSSISWRFAFSAGRYWCHNGIGRYVVDCNAREWFDTDKAAIHHVTMANDARGKRVHAVRIDPLMYGLAVFSDETDSFIGKSLLLVDTADAIPDGFAEIIPKTPTGMYPALEASKIMMAARRLFDLREKGVGRSIFGEVSFSLGELRKEVLS